MKQPSDHYNYRSRAFVSKVQITKREKIHQVNKFVQELYNSRRQCSNCDIRFKLTESKEYSDHLDWHFQENRKRKKSIKCLNWYPKYPSWIKQEEIVNSEEKLPNFFEIQNILRENSRTNTPTPPSCSAGPNSIDIKCIICNEKFDQVFDNDSEEWTICNAIRIQGIPVHPLCSQDLKKFL